MFNWFKGPLTKTITKPTWGKSVVEQGIEDYAMSRNLREKIAGLSLGKAFGISTRDGIKVFKLIEIRPHPKKEVDET